MEMGHNYSRMEVLPMKIRQRTTFFLGMAVFFVSVHISAISSPSFAVDGQPFGPILGGLKGIYMQVEPIDRETEQKGMSADQLRRDTQRQHTKAGIPLLSEKEFNNFSLTGSYPLARLDISVSMEEVQVGDVTLNVNLIVVKARQQAFLGRKPSIRFYAITWQRQEINYSNEVADVYESIKGIVDEFIAAYMSANR